MKKNLFTLLFISALSISAIGCKDKAKEATTSEIEKVSNVSIEAQKYIVNLDSSSINWKGFKPTGSHFGTINIESGVLSLENDKISGGSFLINMSTIKVLDIPAEKKGNAKLTGHLKGGDFFDVENHPNAAFEVTSTENVEGKTMLSGNLSIKGIKQNITFPVSVTNSGDDLTLTSETFTIDRSKWEIKHQSKSFFDDLGDKFINDDIEISIKIVASKS